VTDDRPGLARLLAADVDSSRLLEELRAVLDPELGVNVVDLGLV
jgi:metal-sulfur cluster biosynthetic enzyme